MRHRSDSSRSSASSPAVAQAQTTGLQAIHGTASMVTQGNKTIITTQNGAGTSHSALNWQSFGVAPGTTTQFNQPSAASTHQPGAGQQPQRHLWHPQLQRPAGAGQPGRHCRGCGRGGGHGGLYSIHPAHERRRRTGRAACVWRRRRLAGGLSVGGHIVARGGDVVLISPDVQTGAKRPDRIAQRRHHAGSGPKGRSHRAGAGRHPPGSPGAARQAVNLGRSRATRWAFLPAR
jgi:hypothetical protein